MMSAKLKSQEKRIECVKCRYRHGNVCNICWKQVYEKFREKEEKANGKTDERNTEASQGD